MSARTEQMRRHILSNAFERKAKSDTYSSNITSSNVPSPSIVLGRSVKFSS